ncbi:MAG: hypothetical protein ACOCXT_04985 [Candidatus Dojkabacteria bacterium]
MKKKWQNKRVSAKSSKSNPYRDSGRKLKTANSLSSGKSTGRFAKIKKVGFRAALLVVILSTVVASYNGISRISSNSARLAEMIRYEEKCLDFEVAELPMVAFIDLIMNNDTLVASTLVIATENKRIEIDVQNIQFTLDGGNTKGTLAEFISAKRVFLTRSKMYTSILEKVRAELQIKVDFILFSHNDFRFSNYMDYYELSLIQQSLAYIDEPAFPMETNVCEEVWHAVIATYVSGTQDRVSRITSFGNPRDYFSFSEVKKEQLRIHIKNSTGIRTWGDFIKAYFEGYGLSVVKVDNSLEVKTKSVVYLNNEEVSKSESMKMVGYLLVNTDGNSEYEINHQEKSIFSDIYIDFATDLLW